MVFFGSYMQKNNFFENPKKKQNLFFILNHFFFLALCYSSGHLMFLALNYRQPNLNVPIKTNHTHSNMESVRTIFLIYEFFGNSPPN